MFGNAVVEFAYSGRSNITTKRDPDNNPPNMILLLTVTNLLYPVTVDVLVQVFAKFGGMDKVVIFNRGNAVQALVQLRDVTTACVCKASLDGQNIYAGCNTLKVQFSSLSELEVKQNNERSFDFTSSAVANPMVGAGLPYQMPTQMGNPMAMVSHLSQMMGGVAPPSLGSGLQSASREHDVAGMQSPVLIVHNLAEGITSCDDLAALFAVYGNVVRVKIMFKARHSALVQLGDLAQCRLAQQHLSKLPLHGKELQVEMSKGGQIPPAREKDGDGSEYEAPLTKDYTDQPLLYARHKSDRPQKSFPPGTTLHVSNMPDNTSEQEIRQLLEMVGCEIVGFRFLDAELHHIAVVTCASLENAVNTLVRAHTMTIGVRQLRVGFGHAPRTNPHMAQDMAMS